MCPLAASRGRFPDCLTSDRSMHRRPTTAFTLVELLVVIAILGLLVALLIPAVQAARAAARRAQCLSNQRQVGIAILNYHSAHGAFPASVDWNFWSWVTAILPELEEQALYDRFDFDLFAFPPRVNRPLVRTVLPVLRCPSDPRSARFSPWLEDHPFGYTNFLAVAGSQGGVGLPEYRGDGIFPGLPPGRAAAVSMRQVTDGSSKTLLVGERPVIDHYDPEFGDWGWWAAGAGMNWLPVSRGDNVLDSSWGLRPGTAAGDTIDDVFHWWSYHPAGAQFVLADGSARILSYRTDYAILLALSTRAGGELASEP